MKHNDDLIKILKQNRDNLFNGSKDLKWNGLNEQLITEIKRIPKRYKRYVFVKSAIAASIVFMFITVFFSGYYFYYLQPNQQYAAQKNDWDMQDYDLYEEIDDYELYAHQTDDSEYDFLTENSDTIDQELIDIDSQLQWMAQPLWQTTL